MVKIPRWPFDKFPLGDRTHRHADEGDRRGDGDRPQRSRRRCRRRCARSRSAAGSICSGRTRAWTRRRRSGEQIRATPTTSASGRRGGAAPRRRHARRGERRSAGIDPWFLRKLAEHRRAWRSACSHEPLDARPAAGRAKRLGFSDAQIGTLADLTARAGARRCATSWDIAPGLQDGRHLRRRVRRRDAVLLQHLRGGERGAAARPGEARARHRLRPDPHRPGHRVRLLRGARRRGRCRRPATRRIMVNSNPETVSTDFDTSDRLYFEPLDEESVREILGTNEESADGRSPAVIVQFGGQTAINLAEPLTAPRRADHRHRATRRSTWPRTAGGSRTSSAGSASRSRPAPAVTYRRRGAGDGAEDRLPGAGAAQLRARRARHGDRPQRGLSCRAT